MFARNVTPESYLLGGAGTSPLDVRLDYFGVIYPLEGSWYSDAVNVCIWNEDIKFTDRRTLGNENGRIGWTALFLFLFFLPFSLLRRLIVM